MNIKDFITELQYLEGCSIKNCYRKFTGDSDHIPIDIRNEEADGDIFLSFSNKIAYRFKANTEHSSIEIDRIDLNEIPLDSQCISKDDSKFWNSIIGKKISNTIIICNKLEHAYGVRFITLDKFQFDFLYLFKSEYDFDSLLIRKSE
ncbi:hypothetical protein [Flavobacterium subsaxonicum]|uniref:Uncharacterized protein n=1 Tax=Flavobacterium subsaxonicum WB 4.1-42 = DSM 21790 TaxID=1121898 RepID=A0A0A2MZE4_9FLAO|nr:hypothetical protein [Flavobacterium subsaxonicum]KGO93585.1 hypothetical protein Q766_06345 [Flavobacterium subsaxonicum WB 4.1-42 = DSM 21790]